MSLVDTFFPKQESNTPTGSLVGGSLVDTFYPKQTPQPQFKDVAIQVGKNVIKNTIKNKATEYFTGFSLKKLGQAFVGGAKTLPGTVKEASGIILDGFQKQSQMMDNFFSTGVGQAVANIPGLSPLKQLYTPSLKEAREATGEKVKEKALSLREAGTVQKQAKLQEYSETTEPSKGLQGLLEMAAFNLPQMFTSFGMSAAVLAVTKSPSLATTVGLTSSYGLGSSEVYGEARSQGLTDSQALPLSQIGGVLIGAMEYVPMGRLLKQGAKENFKKAFSRSLSKNLVSIAQQSGWEGITESIQEIIGNALAMTYNENKDLFENVTEAGLVGFILGGFAEVTFSQVMGKPDKVVEKAEKKVSETIKKSPETRTPEETQLVEAVTTREMTPDQAMTYVIDNNLGKSKQGKQVVKLAVQAKQEEQNILVKVAEDGKSLQAEMVSKEYKPVEIKEEAKREVIKIDNKESGVKSAVATIKPDGTAGLAIELDKSAQNKGVGTKVVAELEQKLIAKGVTKVEMSAFTESVGFWEKQGYTQMEGAVEENGMIRMEKTLSKAEPIKETKKEVPTQPPKEADPMVKEAEILRGTKGMTADDIMKTFPDIKLKRDVPATDVYGNKVKIPDGEVLTPYEMKGNKILLQDGETYIVSKSQFQNIKGQSTSKEVKEFAPELKGTEESVLGQNLDKVNTKSKYAIPEVLKIGKEWQGNADEALWLTLNNDGDAYRALTKKFPELANDESWAETVANDVFGTTQNVSQTRYSQFQLPGGKNYKEILIKAPTKLEGASRQANADKIAKELYGKTHRELWESGKMDEWNKVSDLNKTAYGNNFKSPHWDDPNVISHLRMNERTYKDKKVAFVEEIQSDWMNEGRKKGFGDSTKIQQLEKEAEQILQKAEGATDQERAKLDERLGQIRDEQRKLTSGIPFNPLLKKWQELTIKRALQEAVNSDAKYLSWINGEQTSARYNLATQVESVDWTGSKTNRVVKIQPKEGSRTIEFQTKEDGTIYTAGAGTPEAWIGKKLDEVLGKGLADKIMEKKSGTLSGEGLKFGGEWASNLYDKQIPNIVKDLTGGKVEVLDLGLPIEKGQTRFIQQSGRDVGGVLSQGDLKVGLVVHRSGAGEYIITEVLGDGKFKALPKDKLRSVDSVGTALVADGTYKAITTGTQKRYYAVEALESFDITQKTTTQQGIEITPEIKARVKGEAPDFKASGKQFETQPPKGVGEVTTEEQGFDLKTMSKESREQMILVSEALKSGDVEAAKSIYEDIPTPKPTFEQIQSGQKNLEKISRTPYRGEIGKLEKQIDELIGFDGGSGNYKKAYAQRESVLKQAKLAAPPEVIKELDKLENALADLRNARESLEQIKEGVKGINKPSLGTTQINEIKNIVQGAKKVLKPVGRGAKKTSKLAIGIEAKAIEKQLTADFGDLPQYRRVSMKDQAKRAVELVNKDADKARRISLGEVNPPSGLLPESVLIALEDKALAEGNVNLLRELSNSELTTEATAMGQRIRTLGERDPDSAIVRIREVTRARQDAIERKRGKPIDKLIDEETANIKRSVKPPTKGAWGNFINSIEC